MQPLELATKDKPRRIGSIATCAFVVVFATLGCGKTELDLGQELDCPCVVGVCDALGRCVECLAEAECDDEVACTNDSCVEGLCQHETDASRCDAGVCDAELGCVACRDDSECDDGVSCTDDSCRAGRCDHEARHDRCGDEFCDVEQGCVACRVDADCHDGHSCTADTCRSGACVFVPDDAACPDDLVCERERGCVGCRVDADCTDAVTCSEERCVAGACTTELDDASCSSGRHCDAELGCVECASDAECQDGLVCNGQETCRLDHLCAPAVGVVCDDGIACTVDACSEASAGCFARPDHSLCPNGERCSPTIGCTSHPWLYAHAPGGLYWIDLEPNPPTATFVGPFDPSGGLTLTDIAELSDGRLFGVSFDTLYAIDPATGLASEVGPLVGGGGNGLTVAPDGTLYLGSGSLFRVDPTTAVVDSVGDFPPGISSSGDIVWGPFGGIFMSDAEPGGDRLVSLDPLTAQATPIGPIGFDGVWGLAFRNGILFGLTSSGELLRLDPHTGAGTLVHDFGVGFWGGT